MKTTDDFFDDVTLSLADIAGRPYCEAVCAARAALSGENAGKLRRLAEQRVAFFPRVLQRRLRALLPRVGEAVAAPWQGSPAGATTAAFAAASHPDLAPLSGLGCFRIGEDGRLRLAAKSEHYHASLGHAFPGYRLLEHARRLGIPNATHNNTRGAITRRLEEELVRAAHGLAPDDAAGLARVRASRDPRLVNRVLNLETGSLAAEAALKMVLARFHRVQDDSPPPPHAGRVPVILVMGNDQGGLQANYHGTTILTQALRGMWPDLHRHLEARQAWKVVPLRPNRLDDLEQAFAAYERPPYKVAGFLHEIVMMNYGGRVLTREFLQRAYALCQAHDAATVVDEIQSCMWYPGYFLFREYGLQPTFVALGKGFPGGEYPASRLLLSAAYDSLSQFGALVTNGQEELASLAYLITMRWARANAGRTRQVGAEYESRLRGLAARHAGAVRAVHGIGHLAGLEFADVARARRFAAALTGRGIDISVQTYKADCPPVALTKLPLIADRAIVDFVVARMEEALS